MSRRAWFLVFVGVVLPGFFSSPVVAAPSSSPPADAAVAARGAAPAPSIGEKFGGVDPATGDYRGLRTQFSRTFPGRSGSLHAELYAEPINYRDRDGKWQPIDNTLEPANAPGAAFRNKGNGYSAEFPGELGGPVKFQIGDDWATQALQGLHGSGAANGASITYSDKGHGLSVSFTATNDALTDQVVLDGPSSPHEFVYDLGTSAGLRPVLTDRGTVDFVGPDGRARFSFTAPIVWDASGGASRSASAVTSSLSADGSTLTVTVDEAWLSDPARQWPVTVDPASRSVTDANNCSLNSAAPTTNSCNNTTFDVAHTTQPKTLRELMTFSIDRNTFPYATDVSRAELNLPVAVATSGTSSVSVHQLTRGYTTAATWNTYDGVHAWTTAGGDFAATSNYTRTAMSGFAVGDYPTWDLAPLVQGWMDGSIANNGLMVKLTNETTAADYAFNDRGGNGRSAYLSIDYAPRIGQRSSYATVHQQLTDRMSLDVNPATGNAELTSIDLPMHSMGPDISVVRAYNSFFNSVNGVSNFGGGWFSGPTDALIDTQGTCAVADGGGGIEGPDGWLGFWHAADDTGSGTVTTSPGVDAAVSGNSCAGTAKVTFNTSHSSWSSDGSVNGQVITSSSDRNGRTATYCCSADYPDLTVTDVEGRTLSYTGGNATAPVTQIVDNAGGRTVTYTYDPTGYFITDYQDAAGGHTLYEYDVDGNMTKVTDPVGKQTIMGYDTKHRITSLKRVTNNTTGVGYSWTFVYTQNATDAGGSTTVTDPNSHVTTYFYDNKSRSTKIQDPNGNTNQTAYTSNSNPQTLTDGLSAITTLNYDNNNNLTSLVSPASGTGATAATTTLRYNTTGSAGGAFLPSSVTSPQSACTAYRYDPAGNITNAYAGQTGNCDGLTGGSNFANSYQGDTSVPSCTSDGLTTTYPGMLCSTTYANQAGTSNQNTYRYTFAGTTPKVLNSLDERQPGFSCTTPRKLCQTTTFDSVTRVSTSTDSSSLNGGAGEKTTYCYDVMDRITKLFYTAPATSPNCTTGTADIAYTYDADGNLTQRVDNTGTTTFGYDDLNRVVTKNTGTNVCSITVQTPTGSVTYQGTVCFTLDGVNITGVTDSNGTTAYTYDSANRLTRLVEPTGTTGCTVTPKTLTSLCTAFAYNNNNQRTTTQYPGGATLVVAYDTAGHETAVTGTANAGGTALTKYSYCYQVLVSGACPTSGTRSDRTQIQQTKEADTRATVTTDYLYDAFDRICSAATAAGGTCAAPPAGANKYTYDAAGNRTQQTVGGTTSYFAYNAANQLCWKSTTSGSACASPPVGANTFTYDNIGNLASSANPTSSFTYNTKNQTTAITNNAISLTNLTYADVGQSERTASTQGANTTAYLNTPLGLDKSTTGATSTYIIRDPMGIPIGFKDSAGAHWYYLLDGQGSVVAAINSAGSTIGNRYAYDEYGRSTYTFPSPTVTQPLGYIGGLLDTTGLIKFGERYYDPTLGRWTQQDPVTGSIVAPATVNRYMYAADDPVDNMDPTGRSVLDWLDDQFTGNQTGTCGAAGLLGAIAIGGGIALAPFTAGESFIAGVAGANVVAGGEYICNQ